MQRQQQHYPQQDIDSQQDNRSTTNMVKSEKEKEAIAQQHLSVKKVLREATEYSTIARFERIFRVDSWFLKIVFLLILVLSFAYCCVQIVQTFVTFFAFNVITTSQR